MTNGSELEILPPSSTEGCHRRAHARFEKKIVEIGKVKAGDTFKEVTFVDCELRILCSASGVSLVESTLEGCTVRTRRELKNLRLTGLNIRGCTFLGKYTGCRFGRELDTPADVRDCDFSQATRFHLCDFLDDVDIGSLKWPSWPHIVVTDLPSSRAAWLRLALPQEMKVIQQVIADPESAWRAVTLYLPAVTEQSEQLRDLFAKEPYIAING